MNSRSILLSLTIILASFLPCIAQTVVVSEYCNMADPAAGEWNEILVVQDNLDMRGYMISDNNTNQNARQGGVRCKNIDFWKNVRAGTIIGIWHRNYPTNSPLDSDAVMSDGRIMLAALDLNFFDQVEFVTGNVWSFNCFNLSRTGDFIEVFNKDTVHIHAIGHKDDTAPGSYWFSMPAPKTNVLALCEDRSSNRVYPGSTLSEYNGPNLEVRSQTCGVNVTRTLPNKDCSTGASNYQFWHTLRQPAWNSPTLQTTISSNQVILNWNTMLDANPADGVQGYLVVRDSGSVPFAPVDGRVYTNGERISSAVVLANLGSQVLSFSDNIDLPCGVIYTYRVFAYRFAQDDEYGVNTPATSSRGRQYNRDNSAFREAFKQVAVGPKLQYAAGQTSFCEGSSLTISVPAQPGFTAQWLMNGTDIAGETGISMVARASGQYRLKLRNSQGCLVLTDSVDVLVHPLPIAEIFPKTLSLCKDSTALLQATASADYSYVWMLNGTVIGGATDAQYLANQNGDYTVKVTNKFSGCIQTSTASNIKAIVVNYQLSASTVTFADLADCVSFSDDNSSAFIQNNSSSDSLRLNVIESAHFSVISPSFPLALGPGQKVPLVLRFIPTTSLLTSETIRFVSTPCGAVQSITLNGRKPNLGAGVSTSSTSKDFGVVAWCSKQSVVDSVLLSVTQNTTITSISVPQPFSISAADQAGFSMNAGDSRRILVTFNSNGNPGQVGKQDLVIRYKAGVCDDSVKINLRGAFTLPQLLADVGNLTFPPLDSCAVLSRDTVIHITNTSTLDVELSQLTEPSLSIVEIVGSGTLKIPAGATVPVTLRFAPAGFARLTNKQVTFSALPCIDLSGFFYNGERRGIRTTVDKSEVDFGDITVCNGISSTPQSFKLNVQSFNGAVATVSDLRCSSTLFRSSIVQGQSLNPGDNTVTISVNALSSPPLGSFDEVLFITLSPCDVQQQIHIKGRFIGQSVRLVNSTSTDTTLEYGSTDINVPVVRYVNFVNNSAFPVTVGAIPNLVGPYVILSNPGSGSVLAPGDHVFLTITFIPAVAGSFSLQFPIPLSQPCTDTLRCFMNGIARPVGLPAVPFHFAIGNYTSTVGQTLSIPINIVGSNLLNRQLTKVDVVCGFNTSMLKINTVRVGSSLLGFTPSFSMTPNGVRLIAQGDTVLHDAGVGFIVDATVLLGDALQTPLFIDTNSVNLASTELISDTPQNGSLSLQGTCNLGNRLLKIGGTVGIVALQSPGSSDVQLMYETVGEQRTTIELYTSVGDKVCTMVDGVTKPGVHQHPLHSSDLSQGTYFVTMQSGTSSHTLMIQIVR